jgi:hypothetical protein
MVFGMIFFLLLRRDEIKKRKWEGKKCMEKPIEKPVGSSK